MDGDGHGARTGSTISADLAELKRAAVQLAAMIMEWASHLPKGARRTIAFMVWELLLYGMNEKTAEDQPMTIRAKFEALQYAIECCVPLEPQKHKGSMIELIEGSDSVDIDDDDPEEKGKARKKLTTLEANNKRLAKDLGSAYAQIADLTAQVAHLRDMKSRQPAPAQSATPRVSESSSALVEEVHDLEMRLEQALTLATDQAETIKQLRGAQQTATVAFGAQAETASSVNHSEEAHITLSPWASSRFKLIAGLTGITLEQFVNLVRGGRIERWRREQIAQSRLDTYQSRFVTGIAKAVAEQLGKMSTRTDAAVQQAKPAPTKPRTPIPAGKPIKDSGAVDETITVEDRTFAESDFLSHPFAKAWYSAVHKETGNRLATLVAFVWDGTITQWLESMDRSSPPERTRRCAVALLRHIATVLGVSPIEKKRTKVSGSREGRPTEQKSPRDEKPARTPRAQAPKPIKEDRHGLSPWAWGHFKKTAELTGITFEQFRTKVENGTIEEWRDEQRTNGLLSDYQWRFVAGISREVVTMLLANGGVVTPAPQPQAPPTPKPEPPPPPPDAPAKPVETPVPMSLEQAVNGAALFGFLMDQDAVDQYVRLRDAGYLRSLMQVCQAAGYDGALKNYVASRMEAMTGTLDDVLIQDAVELARHAVAFVPIWNGGGCLDDDKLMAHAISAGREDVLEPVADPQPRPKPVPVVLPAQPAPKPPLENGDSNEIDDELIRHIKSLNRRNVLKGRLVGFYDRLRSLGFCEDLWDLFRIVEVNQTERRIEWMLSNTSTSDYDVRNARELCRFVKNELGVIDRVTHRLSSEGLSELVRIHAHKRTH